MKSLYKYIHESLLDDEDEIFDRAEEAVVREQLAKINAIICKNQNWRGGEHVKFVENFLVFIDIYELQVTAELSEALIDLHKVHEFDTICAPYKISILDGALMDGKLIQVIKASHLLLGYRVDKVSNIIFDLSQDPRGYQNPRFVAQSLSKGLTMTNVEIYMGGVWIINKLVFSQIPTLKNVKIEGAQRVNVYGALLFDNMDCLNKFNGFFDPKYKYNITDSTGKTTMRKGDMKTIVATFNNPKKYPQTNMVEPPYSIQPNAKIKDILDPEMFGDSVNLISFANNNVAFTFYRDDSQRQTPKISKTSSGPIDLPNDKRWKLEIAKK